MDRSPSVGVSDLDSPTSDPQLEAAGDLVTGVHHDGQPTYVVTVPRGRVAGYYGSVIAPGDCLLADVSFGFVDDERHHPIRRQLKLGPVERLEGTAATVAFGHADAYFHWLFDVLPRLEILRLAGWEEHRWDHLVVNGSGAGYERETLHRFDVPADKVRQLDEHGHILADQLVVPSTVGISGIIPPWACELLRSRLLPAQRPDITPLRLYISRSDTEQRRVDDEDRLVAMLDTLGFTCLTLSGRPLDEQIDLFSRAEVVVGPHGGGLSNLVWCRPGTAVVELYANDYVNPVFWGLSENLQIRHHHVIGHPATPGLPRSYGAMVVDHDSVLRLTERALEGIT
jgi:capsular polysaccharide biosynthesis protein